MTFPFVVPDPVEGSALRIVGEAAPRRTSDWMRALVAALTHVATHTDSLRVSTLFTADTEPGEGNRPERDTMAVLRPVAPALAPEGVALLKSPHMVVMAPAAWLVIHPAGADPAPDLEEPDGLPIASGAILLPGMPELGLDHRAAWAAVDTTGQVAHMRYTTHARLTETVDLAVLAALIEP